MDTLPYHDFRGFIEEAKKVSEWRLIEGADWNNEIGALIEATAELDSRPMLLFDKIKDYPAGFRLVSLAFANYKRTALAFGICAGQNQARSRALAGAQDEVRQIYSTRGGQEFAADGKRHAGRPGRSV